MPFRSTRPESALPRRLSLFSPALAVGLSPRLLRALQARFGGMDGVDLEDPLAVARALFARELPERLAGALEDIERLSSGIGREAILEAARGRGEELAHWLGEPPVDLAARFVLLADRNTPNGALARRILRRARVRVARYFSLNVSYEVVLPSELGARCSPEEALLSAAREVHGARLAHAWTVEHEGVVYGAFLHEGLTERLVRREGGALRRRTSHPIVCDRARWDRARMRLGFQLARPALLPEWTAGVGRACKDDPTLLAARPAFSLRRAHEDGISWLDSATLPAVFRGVSVVGCELDDGSRYSARSPNALADLHERLGAKGGHLVRITLRFELRAGGTTDATIELPTKLTIADPRYDRAVREALDALLLTAPGTLADDLASLAPFEHAAWRWSEVLTLFLFERNVALGLFTQSAKSRRAADIAHRPYGSSLIVHPLEGEETQYALGEDLSVHAYDVPPGGAVRWKLDTPRFAARLAQRLQLDSVRLKHAPPPGFLSLGALPLGAAHACIFQSMRVVRPSEAGEIRERLRVACGPAHAVVFMGKGRTLGEGIAQVEVDLARLFEEDELPDLIAAIAAALGAEDEIEPWRYGSKEKPLVLLAGRGQAWFGRVRLLVTVNQMGMLLGLARTPGEGVTAMELGRRISPNAAQLDVVVRRARLDWEERIVQSYEEVGLPMPEDLPDTLIDVDKAKGLYRLGVGVVVRP